MANSGYDPRAITFGDVMAALRGGFADFRRAPLIGLFFGGIHAAGGLALYLLLAYFRTPWLIIPLALGFPLLGPFVAAGLYETSRRLSRGEPISWGAILSAVVRQSRREMGWMAFVVLFVFWVWLYQVRLMIALFKAFSSFEGFIDAMTNGPGLGFLAAGTISGAILATILFALTVMSMPMLLDREVDFITAMLASIRTVTDNPGPMLGFGVIVALLTFLALLPAFLGLLVVLPVLGHATWRLYARAFDR
jgi:uncharacterized membrane protein